ncbi:MAG: O-antigen ligase family protein [Patescibacteria group bacterium]
MSFYEKGLLWAIVIGIFALLLTPLIISATLFFPFITGKNFFFRIIVEIITAAWFVLACTNPLFRPKKSPVLIAFALFMVALFISSIAGVDSYHSFWSNYERMEGYITHIHLFLLFLVLVSVGGVFKNFWAYLVHGSIAVSAIAAVHGLLQARGVLEILGESRPFARFGNSIYLGIFLLFHLFLLAYCALRVRYRGARVAYGVLAGVEFITFVLVASRGAFVGFVVGALVGLIVAAIMTRKRWVQIAVPVSIGVVGLFALIIFRHPNNPIVRNVELFSRFSSVNVSALSNDPRVMIWGIGWEGFKERPIFGWGPENFIVVYGKYYNPNLYGNEPWFDRTHNMLLEWLVAGGVVGFTAYMSLFGTALYMLVQAWRRSVIRGSEASVLISMLVGYLIQNAFVFDNITSYILVIGALAYVHSLGVSQNPIPRVSKSREGMQLALSAVAFVVVMLLIYQINIRPLVVSAQIISALQPGPNATTETLIANFDKAISSGTFGATEARERLADMIVQGALQFTGKPSPQVIALLDRGIAEMEKEVELQPHVAKYSIFAGKLNTVRFHWTGESIQRAENEYRHALELAPRYVQTYLGLAELYLAQGKMNEAVSEADQAFKLAPRSASMFYAVLSTHMLAGDADGAIRVLNEFVVSIDQKQGQGFQLDKLDEVLVRSLRVKEPANRLRFIEALIARTPLDGTGYIVTAQTYAEVGRYKDARTYAEKAVEKNSALKEQVDEFLRALP